MKKIVIVVTLIVMMATVSQACFVSPDSRLQIPFGKWENTELGLILDINPAVFDGIDEPGNRWRRYAGLYMENGEKIDIVILFFIGTGGMQGFSIYRCSDRYASPTPMLYSSRSNHQIRDNRLYLTVFDGTETVEIVLELIEEYEVD